MNSRKTFKWLFTILIFCYKILSLTNLQKYIIFYYCDQGPLGFLRMYVTWVLCLFKLQRYETFFLAHTSLRTSNTLLMFLFHLHKHSIRQQVAIFILVMNIQGHSERTECGFSSARSVDLFHFPRVIILLATFI